MTEVAKFLRQSSGKKRATQRETPRDLHSPNKTLSIVVIKVPMHARKLSEAVERIIQKDNKKELEHSHRNCNNTSSDHLDRTCQNSQRIR